jgi:hypothetical protein
MGKVLLYDSRSKDAEPAMTMKCEVGSQLPVVLEKMGNLFSPLKSKSMLVMCFKWVSYYELDTNSHIFM